MTTLDSFIKEVSDQMIELKQLTFIWSIPGPWRCAAPWRCWGRWTGEGSEVHQELGPRPDLLQRPRNRPKNIRSKHPMSTLSQKTVKNICAESCSQNSFWNKSQFLLKKVCFKSRNSKFEIRNSLFVFFQHKINRKE